MRILFVAITSLLLTFPLLSFPPGDTLADLSFEVDRIDPPLSLSREKLDSVETLGDLNKHFKSSWVREYHSVEIMAFHQGMVKKVLGEDGNLSQAQKMLIKNADEATEISVRVDYLPENTLVHNDDKEFDFSFLVNPDQSAKYPEDYQALKEYLKEVAISKIPRGIIENYEMAAVKFTVDEGGHIVDAHVFWSSEDTEVDNLLLDAINQMPKWIPAQYDSGRKVKQEFAFSVGNRKSCVTNLLNIAEY